MGLGLEKLDDVTGPDTTMLSRLGVAWRRIPQPTEQNRLQSVSIAISIPNMMSLNNRLVHTR